MKRGMWWPIGITAVLAITVGANFWVLAVANDDPSFAIEPDYYQKALKWDDEMSQQQRNATLKWQLTPALAPFGQQGAVLTVRLTDSTGAALTGATVTVAALANARANAILDATLAPAPHDSYAVVLPIARAGEWELRFEAVRGAERFTAVRRVEATPQPRG